MAFPPAFLDELRARLSLAAVIGRRVKLQKAGREWKGCCPFHNEKTPSFYINEDKGFYHCFGCGAHGDVIRFVVEQEGLRFPEAVKQLAAEAGLDVPEESLESRERAKAQAGLTDVMTAAATYYADQLAGLSGANARRYIEQRGLKRETVRRFGLGFAPDGNRLKAAFKETGEEKLIEIGLLGRAEDRDETYDRFRNRLMFPIRDRQGRVVGFGGRLLGEGQPKYLNSPDTPLFDKGRLLYNLDQAGPVARKSGRLIVVEGYMDVIALAQAGIEEAVAPLGTALTEAQLALLWRIVPEPTLCFDGDAAGQRAAVRAAVRALPMLEPGRSLKLVTLPAGQDPDDIVRAGGAAAFEALERTAEPLIDTLWRIETEGIDLHTPERRAAVRERLREHAQAIQNASVRALYDAEFRARFDALFARRRNARFGPATTRVSPALKALRLRDAGVAEAMAMLVGLIEHPALVERHAEAIAQMPIADSRLSRLRMVILDALAHDPNLDKTGLAHTLAENGLGVLVEEIRQSNQLSYSFTRADAALPLASRDLEFLLWSSAARRLGEELSAMTARQGDRFDEADYAEQQRLRAEKMHADQELMRLAQLRREQTKTAGDI